MAKVKDYDFKEATWKFVALKGLETLIILFIVYGFYFIGFWVNGLNGTGNCGLGFYSCPYTESTNALSIWGIGLLTIIFVLGALLFWFCIIAAVALLVALVVWLNWDWAKRWAETPEGRKKRLRKKYTFIEGDKVRIEKGLDIGDYYNNMKFVARMKKYEGKSAVIKEMIKDDEGDRHYILDVDKGEFKWTVDMLEKWNPKK
jgi:hypothetical protein